MLGQLITTICGLALSSQVNACSITLQQATIRQSLMVDQKLNSYRILLEKSEYNNKYTRTLMFLGNIAQRQELKFQYKYLETNITKERVLWTVRWQF